MSPIDWCCYCTHRLWLGFQRNINFIKRYTNSFLFIILYIIYIKLYIRRPRPTQGRARQGRRVSGNSKCHNSKTSYIQQQWRQYLEQQQQQRPAAPTTHACTYTHTHVYFPTWSLHPSPPSFSSASLPFPTSASSLFSIIIAPLQRPPCSGACMASTQGSTPSSGVSPATSCSPLTCAPTNAHALAHRHTDTHTHNTLWPSIRRRPFLYFNTHGLPAHSCLKWAVHIFTLALPHLIEFGAHTFTFTSWTASLFILSPKPSFSQDVFSDRILAMKFSGLGFILLTDVPKCHSVAALLSRAELQTTVQKCGCTYTYAWT